MLLEQLLQRVSSAGSSETMWALRKAAWRWLARSGSFTPSGFQMPSSFVMPGSVSTITKRSEHHFRDCVRMPNMARMKDARVLVIVLAAAKRTRQSQCAFATANVIHEIPTHPLS